MIPITIDKVEFNFAPIPVSRTKKNGLHTKDGELWWCVVVVVCLCIESYGVRKMSWWFLTIDHNKAHCFWLHSMPALLIVSAEMTIDDSDIHNVNHHTTHQVRTPCWWRDKRVKGKQHPKNPFYVKWYWTSGQTEQGNISQQPTRWTVKYKTRTMGYSFLHTFIFPSLLSSNMTHTRILEHRFSFFFFSMYVVYVYWITEMMCMACFIPLCTYNTRTMMCFCPKVALFYWDQKMTWILFIFFSLHHPNDDIEFFLLTTRRNQIGCLQSSSLSLFPSFSCAMMHLTSV